jgi:hypothetical protein
MPGVESVPSNWIVNSGRTRMCISCATPQIAFHRTAESELTLAFDQCYVLVPQLLQMFQCQLRRSSLNVYAKKFGR